MIVKLRQLLKVGVVKRLGWFPHSDNLSSNRQMSIKVAQKVFSRKMIDFDAFKIFPKNVRDLGKFNVAKVFKKLPKVQ